jgi:excisionase family DNA binding protein
MPQIENTQSRLWTPNQLASILGISGMCVRNNIKSGALPAFRVGKHWRVQYPDLEAWLGPERAKSLFGQKA